MPRSHPHFVPETEMGSRQDTAVLLVGTAREFGIDQHAIKSTHGGYWITDELAALVYDEAEEETEEIIAEVSGNTKSTAKSSSKNASGNRAAKNTGTEQE